MKTDDAANQSVSALFLSALRKILVDPNRIKTGPDIVSSYVAVGARAPMIAAVVFPRTEEEIIAITALANNSGSALYSPIHEGLVPPRPGVVVDLSLMTKIVKIDTENLQAHIEPGVTFGRLQSELDGMKLRVLHPASAAFDSVLLTYLEREILFAANRHSNKQVAIVHSILADGRVYRSGSHALPNANVSHREDGGPNISKLLFQSKNCFGIPTLGVVNIYPRFEARKTFAWGFKTMQKALGAARDISRREYCSECFIANAAKLARELKNLDSKSLPEWTVAIAIEGGAELVDYFGGEAGKIASSGKNLNDDKKLSKQISEAFESVWRAPALNIAFYTTYDRLNEFERLIKKDLPKNMDSAALPRLFVPVKRAATFFAQYEFPAKRKGNKKIRDEIRTKCLEAGSFFNAPTGEFARQVFEKTGKYYETLKIWKNHIDKKNIMNTGQIL
ncbi:MAG: FAD-binding oxidoreductase [bacterium]